MAVTPRFLLSLGSNQGQRGSSVLATSGAPTSATQAFDGDVALDTVNLALYPARAGGAWPSSPISVRGPVGATGASATAAMALNNTCGQYGDYAGFAASTTLSSTKAILPQSGAAGFVSYFQPTWSSQLTHVNIIVYSGTGASVTFYLVDVNTGTVWYTSGSYSSIVTTETPNVTLAAGGKYAWYVTGSGACPLAVMPYYQYPATTSGPNISPMPVSGATTAITLSSSAQAARVANSATNTAYWLPYQNAYVYQATFVNTSSASITFQMYNQTATANVGPAYTVGAGAETRIGPLSSSTIPLPSGNRMFWRMIGTTSQTCFIQWQVAA